VWPFRSVPPSLQCRIRPDRALRMAREEYLALSSSPLRLTEPAWFALAEELAWDRLRRAEGLDAEPARDLITLS
jgi:hypothetical protein